MGNKRKVLSSEIMVLVPPELHKKFKKSCTKNYKKMSEVLRDFIIGYVKKNGGEQ